MSDFRVALLKEITEDFGIGRHHSAAVRMFVQCAPLQISEVVARAASKGYTLTDIRPWRAGDEDLEY
jgi:hypothetical protein